jgi:hypothetical protein
MSPSCSHRTHHLHRSMSVLNWGPCPTQGHVLCGAWAGPQYSTGAPPAQGHVLPSIQLGPRLHRAMSCPVFNWGLAPAPESFALYFSLPLPIPVALTPFPRPNSLENVHQPGFGKRFMKYQHMNQCYFVEVFVKRDLVFIRNMGAYDNAVSQQMLCHYRLFHSKHHFCHHHKIRHFSHPTRSLQMPIPLSHHASQEKRPQPPLLNRDDLPPSR